MGRSFWAVWLGCCWLEGEFWLSSCWLERGSVGVSYVVEGGRAWRKGIEREVEKVKGEGKGREPPHWSGMVTLEYGYKM